MQVKEIAYLAVAISVFSLLFSATLFFRTSGVDEKAISRVEQASQQARQEIIEANQELRQEIALNRARIRLMALRAQITAEESYDEAADEVQSIRQNLKKTYANSKETSYETYVSVDSDLNTLENNLRDEIAGSIDSLETAIGNLKEHIEPDPMVECAKSGGTWRQFSNSCADSCHAARNPDIMCAQVITMGCDCGEDMCWNGYTCEPI